VVAINLTDQERMRDVRTFVHELGLPFPVLLDEKGKVRRVYALRGVPTSVFIDTLGVVRLVNIAPSHGRTFSAGWPAYCGRTSRQPAAKDLPPVVVVTRYFLPAACSATSGS